MNKAELQKLIKIEDAINRIAKDELGLSYPDIEYDICPAEAFLEISAYRIPGQIHHWSYGKQYDRHRTIYEQLDPNLPYEVVLNTMPPRAYFLNKNVFAVNVLVMAHVVGHVHFFTHNKLFQNKRRDIIELLSNASERFKSYEKKYGITNVEPILDAAMALQLHVNPFDEETEDQKRERIYEQLRQKILPAKSEFSDIIQNDSKKLKMDIEAFNNKLWHTLKQKTPVEPTDDILRFIIDNCSKLSDWEKDILETLREEGLYYYPFLKTKLMNEGFATFVHEKIMRRLFELNLLDQNNDHGQYIVSNSLVKAKSLFSINPYLVGSRMFEDIEDRWNKGKFGDDWSQCDNLEERKTWNKNLNLGWNKCLDIVTSYNDWFFIQDFLTYDLIEDLDLFIYEIKESQDEFKIVRTSHTIEEKKESIILGYALSNIPQIVVENLNKNFLELKHKFFGRQLDLKHAIETMKHIVTLFGAAAILTTSVDSEDIVLKVNERYDTFINGQRIE